MFPNNETCTAAGYTVCPFTAVPVYQLDFNAMTATLLFWDMQPEYSVFGGDTMQLANGDIEYDLCSDPTSTGGTAAAIYEVTNSSTPQVVWQMNLTGQNAYRGFRIPSLYPNVQW
jgi:arylsulfate sulfotransferase